MPLASASLKQRGQLIGSASSAAKVGYMSRTKPNATFAANQARATKDEAMKENNRIGCVGVKDRPGPMQPKQQQDQLASLIARVKQLELENASLRRCVSNCRAMFSDAHSQAALSMEQLSKAVQLSQAALAELGDTAPAGKEAAVVESRLPVASAAVAAVNQISTAQPSVTTVAAALDSSDIGSSASKPTVQLTVRSRRTVVIDRPAAPAAAAATPSVTPPAISEAAEVIQQQLCRQLDPLEESPESAGQADNPSDSVLNSSKQRASLGQKSVGADRSSQGVAPEPEAEPGQEQGCNDASQSEPPPARQSLDAQPALPASSARTAEQKPLVAASQLKAKAKQQPPKPQKRSQLARSQEKKSPRPEQPPALAIDEDALKSLPNPFIPRHRLARTPPKFGANTSATSSGAENANATFDQLPPLSPPPQPDTRPSTLSPTSSSQLIGRQLAPNIRQRRPFASQHLRRGTFVLKADQPPTPPTPLSPPSPGAVEARTQHALVLSPPPMPSLFTLAEQADFAELPDWPDAEQAAVTTATAATPTVAQLFQRQLRVAPRPSLLPKPLTPPSVGKASVQQRRSSLAVPAVSHQAEAAASIVADVQPPAAKRHRAKQSSKTAVRSSTESSTSAGFDDASAASAPLRPRRMRAGAISYKEPSVNTKMRR